LFSQGGNMKHPPTVGANGVRPLFRPLFSRSGNKLGFKNWSYDL